MKYDIAALKRKMLVKYPFFGSVVASVGYKENKDIPTAGTDGETIYYNPEYLEGLSVEEQTFIFSHEVCHIAFNHILRSEGKNPELWNIATDGVINQFLKRDGLKMASGGVDMAEAINYDAEQLYEKLLQEKQQRCQGNSQQNQQGNQQQSSGGSQSGNNQQQSLSPLQGNSGSGSSQEQSGGESGEDSQKEDKSKQDVGHNTHSMWEQAVKKHKEQQEKIDKKEFKTICDLGQERIRRVANKLKQSNSQCKDLGFRVYKTDSSNMKDIFYKPNDLEQSQLRLFESNIKEDRTTDDLLTQVILDLGLTLDLDIEERMIGDNKVYYVAGNSLVACFDDNIDINIVDKICECEPYKVVFKDSAFKYDNDKINLEERFKKLLPQRASDEGFINIL